MFDLAVYGRVCGGPKSWVSVEEGMIVRVSRERAGKSAAEMVLSDSQFLMPAATDLHVHLRDFAQKKKETVETGTKSAIAGGITTVADMPNTDPKVDSARMVEKRVDLLRSDSYTDFALHAGAPDSPQEVAKMHAAGAFALKLYPPELGGFHELLKETSRAGMKMAVHAEEFVLIGTESAPLAEGVAVRKILQQVGQRSDVRFAHVSTADGASEIARARRIAGRLTMEVSPHHLFMDEEMADKRIGVTKKVNPSLRSRSNSVKMRRMMLRGIFDFYASDHAPHTVEDKFQGSPGFPALEFSLPLFLTKTDDPELVARMYCEAPATYLGLRKGRVRKGYTADLVVVGRRDWKIDPEKFVSKGRVTPFAGETMRYAIDHVLKAGKTVFDGRRVTKTETVLVTGRPQKSSRGGVSR